MNERQKEILRVLLGKSDQTWLLKMFAERLACSEKTIRSDLNNIQRYLDEHSTAVLVRKPGRGVYLEVDEDEKARLFKSLQGDRYVSKAEDDEERVIQIAYQLLMDPNTVTVNTYQTNISSAERYQNIQPLMTDQGYKATYPSGTELPSSDQSVKSSIAGLKSFEYQDSQTEAEFFNEFKLSTEFNDVTNTETVIVKTSLIYVKKQGWKINDVEFIGQLTGRE